MNETKKTATLEAKEWELINAALEHLFQSLRSPYTKETRKEAYVLSAKLIQEGLVEEV